VNRAKSLPHWERIKPSVMQATQLSSTDGITAQYRDKQLVNPNPGPMCASTPPPAQTRTQTTELQLGRDRDREKGKNKISPPVEYCNIRSSPPLLFYYFLVARGLSTSSLYPSPPHIPHKLYQIRGRSKVAKSSCTMVVHYSPPWANTHVCTSLSVQDIF